MNWYIASRTKHKNLVAKELKHLKSKKQTISFDWTTLNPSTPFKEHLKENQAYAKEISESLKNTDIFILLSDAAGTDMFIELGIALQNPKTKIYIVGKHNDRSLMHLHPKINRAKNLKEVYKLEKI